MRTWSIVYQNFVRSRQACMKILKGVGKTVDLLRQDQGDRLVIQPAQQRRLSVTRDQPAVIDDGNAIAKLLRLLQVMGGQKDRRTLGVQAAHIAPQLLAQLDVDAR